MDNRGSGEGDDGVLTRALDEMRSTRQPFPYLKIWEMLRKSPKWAKVPAMGSGGRRRIRRGGGSGGGGPSKRSKTSSSTRDPDTPSSDARYVSLGDHVNLVDEDEDEEEEEEQQHDMPRPPGRRSAKGGKGESSSAAGGGLKDDFEEMNRRLQDIRDLGQRRLETMQQRVVENKRFVELQEARQREKDIEFLSKPIEDLEGDALRLAMLHRQQILKKYDL
jgi:hypothetical protein